MKINKIKREIERKEKIPKVRNQLFVLFFFLLLELITRFFKKNKRDIWITNFSLVKFWEYYSYYHNNKKKKEK